MINMSGALQSFYCTPGVSTKYKSKIGLIAVKDIPPNTKILEKPCYIGQWCYTEELITKHDIDSGTIYTLQDLYRNKKLFMQNNNRMYTFVPTIPMYHFHGEMFLNHTKNNATANVIEKKEGYFTIKQVRKGEELLVG